MRIPLRHQIGGDRTLFSLRKNAQILTDSCIRHEPATVILPGSGQVGHGRFRRLAADYFTIAFLSREDMPSIAEPHCCVTFRHLDRPRAFFTQIEGIADQWQWEVRFGLPRTITSAEKRSALRIPVLSNLGMQVSLRLSVREQLQATPIDLSVSGLLVDLDSPGKALEVGTTVEVDLALDDRSVTLPARVVRKAESLSALEFERNGSSRHELLAEIVARAEEAFFETRSADQAPLAPQI